MYFIAFIFNFSEIAKVRASLFQINGVQKEPLTLPDPDGQAVTLNEKVYVPVKEHPDVSIILHIYRDSFMMEEVFQSIRNAFSFYYRLMEVFAFLSQWAIHFLKRKEISFLYIKFATM